MRMVDPLEWQGCVFPVKKNKIFTVGCQLHKHSQTLFEVNQLCKPSLTVNN
jgi:hypothetical protein